MPENIALKMVYLAYAFRAVALAVGAYFFVLGVRLLAKGQPSHRSGDIKGTWGNFTVAFKNAPAGSIATVLGTLVVVAVLLKEEPNFRSIDPFGRAISIEGRAESSPMLTDEDRVLIDRFETSMGQLSADRRFEGQLSENDPQLSRGNRFSVWEFSAEQGQSVTIDATSDTFDTMLFITGPALQEPLADDDSGDGNNSRISFVAPSSDTYKAIVSAFGRDSVGTYTISLRNE